MAECSVCIEVFNKRDRKPVTCLKCQYIACTACYKRYILESINHAQCISCKNEFTDDFLYDNFTKTFINNEYNEHIVNLLLEEEKALIPNTMNLVDNKREVRKMRLELNLLKSEKEYKLSELERKIIEITTEYDPKITSLNNLIYTMNSDNAPVNINNFKFEKKCIKNDCNGYLSTRWKCAVCEMYVCNLCHMEKLDNHVCNQDDVDTVTQIKKDSKPCPKCQSLIFKIDGCNIMFCTQCATSFCWRTGEIKIREQDRHNPHYFQWLREKKNTVTTTQQDNNCLDIGYGSLLEVFKRWNVFRHRGDKIKDFDEKCRLLSSVKRNLDHIRDVYVHPVQTNVFDINVKNRIEFIMSEITQDEFHTKIRLMNKKNKKQTHINNVYNTFINASNDIIVNFVNTVPLKEFEGHQKQFDVFVSEMINLIKYINESLLSVYKRYNNTVHYISVIGYKKIIKLNSEYDNDISDKNMSSPHMKRLFDSYRYMYSGSLEQKKQKYIKNRKVELDNKVRTTSSVFGEIEYVTDYQTISYDFSKAH